MKLASFHYWADRRLGSVVDQPNRAYRRSFHLRAWNDRDIAGHAWGCGLR